MTGQSDVMQRDLPDYIKVRLEKLSAKSAHGQ
jgi:hypothetical protein